MKIILDENLPRALKIYLSAYEVTTVQEQGWAGVKNTTISLAKQEIEGCLEELTQIVD
jgi:hypothetical protein